MSLQMKILTYFVVFNVLCINSTSVTNSNAMCDHPWKSDFGLAFDAEGITGGSLSGVQNIINGFLSSQVKDNTLKDHLKKCSRSTDCRFSTILDKKKIDEMSLCIKLKESEICYASNCVCQKKERKRAIKPVLNLSKNEDGDMIGNRDKYKLHCEFTKSQNRYSHDKKVTNYYQNMTVTSLRVDSKRGLEERNTTIKEEFYKHQREKETNAGIYIFCFFGGTLLGLLLGVFVTKTYFKRKSKQPKVLSMRNMVYNQNRKTDEDIIFREIAEYSEIPENDINIEVKDSLTQDEERKSAYNQCRKGRDISLHTFASVIELGHSCGLSFEDNSYQQQSLKDLRSKEYLEPTIYQYHTLSQVDSDLDVIDKTGYKDGLIKREENILVNGNAVANPFGLRKEKVDQYKILNERSTENHEIYMPQETKSETSDLCNFNDELSEKEPAYFVLSKIPVNQPVYTNTGNKD